MQIGPYTIERELGRGGMGAVYLGRLPGAAEALAIKVIHAGLAADPELVRRFEREGAVLERLEHPNVVALRGRGRFSGGLWLAMDYVEGESLRERLVRGGPLASPLAGELLSAVAAGMAHAHRVGILHRDLKPANVLIRASDGSALVADFGLALPLDVSRHLTQTGEVLGSPGYLAPEQCGVGGGCTPATDVYGLGALLYAALTGEPPLSGRSLLETLDHVLTRRPRPPRELVPDVDPNLEAICLRSLAKDPSERYGDASEFLDALQREPSPPPRRPWALLGVGGLSLGLVALGVGVALRADPDPSPRPSAGASRTPAPSPPPSPVPLASTLEDALRAKDWPEGRALAAQLAGVEQGWTRYRLLAAELEERGEEGAEWLAAREVALEALRGVEEPEARRLSALIASLRDEGLGERAGVAALRRLRADLGGGDLEGAEGAARSFGRARAEVSIRIAELEPSEAAWRQAEADHAFWAALAPEDWRVERQRALILAGRGKRQEALEALRAAEARALRAAHPWAKWDLYETRANWLLSPGGVRPDQVFLLRSVLAAEAAPSSRRTSAAATVAVRLVQARQFAEALELLEAHPPSPRATQVPRQGWHQVLAQALFESRVNPARLLELTTPEALAGYQGLRLERLRLMRVAALEQVGRKEEAAHLLGRIPPSTARSGSLVEVRAAALVGAEARFSAQIEAASSEQIVFRWTLLGVLESLESVARLDLRPAIAKVSGPLARDSAQLVRALLDLGRWEEALKAFERFTASVPDPQGAVRAARWALRILGRAREDLEPASPEFQEVQRRCRSFVQRLPPRAVPTRGVQALVEFYGSPDATRYPELLADLEAACAKLSDWDELHQGLLRLLQDWAHFPSAPSDQDAFLRRAAERWAAEGSRNYHARLAELIHPGPPNPEVLLELGQEAQAARHPSVRPASRALLRARVERGEAKVELLQKLLQAEAAWSGSLRGKRRELLLEAAELFQPPEAHGPELAASLELLEAWCGPPTRGWERARYLLLKSEALVALGRYAEALEAARPLELLGEGLAVEPRARLEAQLGRAEVLAGVPGGQERIQRALELKPHPRGWVLLARGASGAAQAAAYREALGFPLERGWVEPLVAEIRAAGHSVAACLGPALTLREARLLDPDCGLRVALELFEVAPTREHASLLWRTYALGAQSTRLRAGRRSPALRGAMDRAAKLLSPGERSLALALQAQLRVVSEIASGKVQRPWATLTAANRELVSAAAEEREFARKLRVPIHLSTALDVLGRLRPERVVAYRDEALRLYEEWGEGERPLRLPILIAYHYRMCGRFSEAVELLRVAARSPAAELPEIAGRIQLDLAFNLSDLGDEEGALRSCQEALESLVAHAERARAWLQAAQTNLRKGRAVEAMVAVQSASDICPRTPDERALFLRTQVCWARVLVRAKRPGGVELFLRLEPEAEDAGQDRLVRALILTLGAELDLHQKRRKEALRKAERALALDPVSGDAHVVRLAALSSLGRTAEAIKACEAALADERLAPRDHQRLRVALRALQR